MTDLYQSEKHFLERVADLIPGVAGYRKKEAARDTDKRLREYMARQIDFLRHRVEDFKGVLMQQGRIDLLDDVDLLTRKMARLADLIRYASYGYAGLFDPVKFREQELAQLYQMDVQLLDQVRAVQSIVDTLDAAQNPGLQLRQLQEALNQLDDRFQARSQLFRQPLQE